MEEQGRWKCVGLLCLRFSGLFKYAQGVREKYRRLKQRWHKETCACGDCLFSGVAGMGGTMSFVFRKVDYHTSCNLNQPNEPLSLVSHNHSFIQSLHSYFSSNRNLRGFCR